MNDSVGPRLVSVGSVDTFYGVGFDRWILHSISVIESNGEKLSRCTSPLRHVAIVIRLRVDSSIPRIAYIAYFCTTIIKFRNSYRFTYPSNSKNFLPRRFVCIFKIEKRSRRISSERNFLSANNRNRTYKVFFTLLHDYK